jgi:hypothetical protein
MCVLQSPSQNGGAATRGSSLASPAIAVATCLFLRLFLRPVLLVLVLFSILYDAAAFSATSNSQSPMHTRPCSSNPGPPPDSKAAKESPENKSRETPASPPACLEVKGAPLEFQEFLQAFIRGQKWPISQEQVSAERLSFVRYLEPEELARFAHTEILGGRIVWTEGKVAVQVTMSEAANGFTQVQINAKFQGKGATKEHFARPTGLWPLVSRGTLEGSMIAALQSRADSSRR